MVDPPRGINTTYTSLNSFSHIAACGQTRLGQKVRIRQQMQSILPWVNLPNKFSLFVAVLVFINRSDRVVGVPYLDTRIVCSFCLAIRMISNTVMLLNQNGFSLRRALADNFIVTKRICRSLIWNLQSSWYVAVFVVHCGLRGTLQSSLKIPIDRNAGTDSHGSPDARA
jgi:hypothetical protein